MSGAPSPLGLPCQAGLGRPDFARLLLEDVTEQPTPVDFVEIHELKPEPGSLVRGFQTDP